MFPFKPVALSGKENQVSYANTRLPTEYGDKDEIPNHIIFPLKLVALSGKENQVSYANTRLPTEYGDHC